MSDEQNHAEILKEVVKREKQQGIIPDAEIEQFMKVKQNHTFPKYIPTLHKCLFICPSSLYRRQHL